MPRLKGRDDRLRNYGRLTLEESRGVNEIGMKSHSTFFAGVDQQVLHFILWVPERPFSFLIFDQRKEN
jgi:hypothetical protein